MSSHILNFQRDIRIDRAMSREDQLVIVSGTGIIAQCPAEDFATGPSYRLYCCTYTDRRVQRLAKCASLVVV